VGYDVSVYLLAQRWFPNRDINELTIIPLSEEYFKLIADIKFLEEHSTRGLDGV
jgi:hypothetical protein